MASETTNYKLVKPDPEEFYDIGVQNSNLDKIDTALKELEDNKASSTDLMQLQQEFMSHSAETVADGVHGMGSAASQTYESGIWTPTINRNGVVYGQQYGRYTRLGEKVFIEAIIELTTAGTSSIGTSIYGLPFTSGNVARLMNVQVINATEQVNVVGGIEAIDAISIIMNDNIGGYLQPSKIKDGTIIRISGFYSLV